MKLALLHSFLKKSIEVLAWKDKGIYNLVQFLLKYRFIIKVLNLHILKGFTKIEEEEKMLHNTM